MAARIPGEPGPTAGAPMRRRAYAEIRAEVPVAMSTRAEGTKAKPWNASHDVRLTNSDPHLMRLSVAWLTLIGVTRGRLSFRIAIPNPVTYPEHKLCGREVAEPPTIRAAWLCV